MKILVILSLLLSSQALVARDSLVKEFFIAVNRDNIKKVSRLLKSGVDVNATLPYRGTGFSAIMLVRGVEVARLLVDAGAKVDSVDDKNEMNALHWVIYRTCDPDVAEVLIKKGGIDPNITAPFHPDYGLKTPARFTPVTPVDMAAMTCADGSVIEMLVRYGGDGKFFRELLEKNAK